jgi:hypothetical protein
MTDVGVVLPIRLRPSPLAPGAVLRIAETANKETSWDHVWVTDSVVSLVFLNVNVNPIAGVAVDDALSVWKRQSTRNASADQLLQVAAIGSPEGSGFHRPARRGRRHCLRHRAPQPGSTSSDRDHHRAPLPAAGPSQLTR